MTPTRLLDNAHVLTYGGAGSAIVFWDLSISEACAIISTLCAICGVAVQLYAAQRKLRWLERQQVATGVVMGAMAAGNRVTARKADEATAMAKKASDAVDGAS